MSVSLILPSMNETANLMRLLPDIPEEYELVVVEGGNIEHTQSALRDFPVRVIGQTRRGKGNALVCGCVAATGNHLVMVDTDGSAEISEIPRFIAALETGADFVKGSRYLLGGGSDDLTKLRSAGNLGFTRLANMLFGTSFTDLCYGFNAFSRHMFESWGLPSVSKHLPQWGDGFEIETLFACRAAKLGANITEVPSHEYNRVHGQSNLDAWQDGKRVLRTIWKEWRGKY
ncbi:glycosyltransferase family 2 protein [Corynebacterium sp.]|uniref:glycosyltransferase family 2 protein n=1 Tax=Corynebacterium sp. TaxID=1720 RepID=UPI0026DD991C|nr:glycosyltransferase family 2 protein [Corynebacterium sp.]MDO5076774.1 glycosyltransferase family 2 protein [Corynebacterium sp.]